MRIRTVGHSTRPLATLVAMLQEAAIARLVDVRTFPRSRRHPHFDREALARSLPAAGVAYTHLPELGGMRPPHADSTQLGLREPAFRAYADHMQSDEFARGIAALIALGRESEVAILCAEADPAHCHRGLVADALIARGVAVEHLLEPGRSRPHVLTLSARVDGTRITYPGPATLPGLIESPRGELR